MAKSNLRPTNHRQSPNADGGPQDIKIFHAIVILLLASIIGLILGHRGFFTSTDFNWSSKNNDEGNSLVQVLYDDLESARQPFEYDEFPLDQIFGSKPIWGSLNSGHYFSLKLSTPKSIEYSLMWFENKLNSNGQLNIRHLCDQNDRLDFYSWTQHDFWTFGQQTIIDGSYKISTSFLKYSADSLDWQAKVTIEPSEVSELKGSLSIVQYLTTNDPKDSLVILDVESYNSVHRDKKGITISGYSSDLGEFVFSIKPELQADHDTVMTSHIVGYIDKRSMPISTYLHSKMVVSVRNRTKIYHLPGTNDFGRDQKPNIVAIQILIKSKASLIIDFKSSGTQTEGRIDSYDSMLASRVESFNKNFDAIFKIADANKSVELLGRVALSNMLGSVGYFFGNSYIGSSLRNEKVVPYGPIQLLSGVPSRSFFPRGFLWDEGFHNLLISRWDADLSNKIILSWFNIMNKNGWIPREVILGIESLRRVPNEFVVQRIANANPPAMLLVLERMLESDSISEESLKQLYPRLRQWFSWFNMTQFGLKEATFRWRGRDELSVDMLNPKTLTSGLDDYPRASHPSADEYHIDLRCWMAQASRTVVKIAQRLGYTEHEKDMSFLAHRLSDNRLLDMLHWSTEHQMYCDFGVNTDTAELVWVTKTRRSRQSGATETYRALERQSKGKPTMGCVPEFGYVSLFPMIMKTLDPQSEKLGIILSRLRDENELWTEFGVRSLSKKSKYYRKYNTAHDKPYWRGPIWLNMNYLILTSLNHYSKQEGPYRRQCHIMHRELGLNIKNNVLREFQRSNYIWENYDDITGKGQGSHPFTGWSSLVLLIMTDV